MPIPVATWNLTVHGINLEVTFSAIQHGGQWTTLQQPLHRDFYRLAYPIGSRVFRVPGEVVSLLCYSTEGPMVAPTHHYQSLKTSSPSSTFFCHTFYWWRQNDAVNGLDFCSWDVHPHHLYGSHCLYHVACRATSNRLFKTKHTSWGRWLQPSYQNC
jgi:hypothetical protein